MPVGGQAPRGEAILSLVFVTGFGASCSLEWDRLDPRDATITASLSSSSVSGGGGSAGGVTSSSVGSGGQGGGDGGAGGAAPLGPWQTPTPIPELDVGAQDDDPTFTADALLLCFNSNRSGNSDLFCSTRSSVDDAWGTPQATTALNTPGLETTPAIAPDGLTLWFGRLVNGDRDIYVSSRASRTVPWPTPTVATSLSSSSQDAPGAVTGDGRLMCFNAFPAAGQSDLFLAQRPDMLTDWGPPAPIAELNTAMDDNACYITPDGLRLHFASDRGGILQFYVAERSRLTAPFSTPTVIPELDLPAGLAEAWYSPDDRFVIFSAGMGAMQRLWQSQR